MFRNNIFVTDGTAYSLWQAFTFSLLSLLFLATQLKLSLNMRLQIMKYSTPLSLLKIWMLWMPIDNKEYSRVHRGICSHPAIVQHKTGQQNMLQDSRETRRFLRKSNAKSATGSLWWNGLTFITGSSPSMTSYTILEKDSVWINAFPSLSY
jgi:hypothetical protein